MDHLPAQHFTDMNIYSDKAIQLLQQLVAVPSFSGSEEKAADILSVFFSNEHIPFERKGNNIIVKKSSGKNDHVILLNSHIDTVRPGTTWTKDPFGAEISEGKLFGLGSNDAGASLVSLLAAFLYFYNEEVPFDLMFVASAEEENSGKNGVSSLLADLGKIDLAIVGEPTQMQMAIAEKGLLVLDCIAHGKTGHAAREEGENAIYNAIEDIKNLQQFSFGRISPLLGKVKLTTTMISAGTQHNVVPDKCSFTVDVRYNELYSPEEIIETLQKEISSEIIPRSLRLRSSSIDMDHPIISAGVKAGIKTFGSSTLSDMTLLPFPSVKIGPGDSARSHTPDEYIFLSEIEEGIHLYIQLLYNFAETRSEISMNKKQIISEQQLAP
jgi:acetylornithine deacetylase